MKKIVFVMGFLMIMSVSWAYPSEKVSQKVLTSFKTEFTTAQDVDWETGSNYFRAAFTMNEQRIFAYYNVDGQLLSIARYISSIQLPVNLYADLKNDYSKYWISDLFEVSNSEGLHYYVTLETADTKLVMHSSNGGSWSTYSKNKKI
ncbi:MAG TPA: hypothetical protein VFU29_17505 [Chitinophagaceae bacterium]|nr:hypothetical protein [Chitinophagaceae bacterium]